MILLRSQPALDPAPTAWPPLVHPRKGVGAFLGLVLVLLGSSCASYNERTYMALEQFESGRFGEAIVAYREDGVTESKFLKGAESGTVAFVDGRWGAALKFFTQASQAVREVEDESLLHPERALESLAAWTVSETLTDYHGEGYERALLHSCLGLTYLALGKVEDLLVEVRRSNALLEAEEELYEVEYGAGGMGHFISALGYELRGDLDEAYIDYKRMEAKGLGGALVGSSLVRLARTLGRENDLAHWTKRFGEDTPPSPDAARVVLIAGVGAGPLKREGRLEVMTDEGLLAWAVPQIQLRPSPVGHVVLEANNLDAAVSSVIIEDVGRIRAKNLDDRLALLATRSTVRTFLKRALRNSVEEEHGEWAGLAADIFTSVSERADLRTWSTLPDTWQAARMFLPPGAHELTVTAQGGQTVPLGVFELEPGETMFLMARTLRRRLHVQVLGGNPLTTDQPTPAASVPVEG